MDLQVTTVDANGIVKFGFGSSTPKALTGMPKLTQLVTTKLLKTPGRDIISPQSGGGMLGLIGGNFSSDDKTAAIAEISPMIKKVEAEMFLDQMNEDLPADERLQKLNLVNIEADAEDFTSYVCTVEIINESEDISTAVVNTSQFSGG